MSNRNLTVAKADKNDEFYTRIEDVDAELSLYADQFDGRCVYLPCDGERSAFWKWFSARFSNLGLDRLCATHYEEGGDTYGLDMRRDAIDGHPMITKHQLVGNGDFRSDECQRLMDECDAIVTNPPFSLEREFLPNVMGHMVGRNGDVCVIGPLNMVLYNGVFPYIRDGRLWFGKNRPSKFVVNDDGSQRANVMTLDDADADTDGSRDGDRDVPHRIARFGNIIWYTTFDRADRHVPIELTATFRGHESEYPRCDNADAINVNRVKLIPRDYDGVMAVPITFMQHHCPEQFDITGALNTPLVDGKRIFKRVLIRRIK